MSAADYHGDTHGKPALSATTIKTLLAKSPAHAWAQHPANPAYIPQPESAVFDRGTASHALFLEDDSAGVVVLDFDDYRTKAAKEARDYARSLGQIPMLQKHWDDVSAMVAGLRDGVASIGCAPRLFVGGKAEQTVVWDEGGVFAKMRVDYLHDDWSAVDDLKTTDRSAAPERISGMFFGNGLDVQAAWYLRGVRSVTGKDAVFRFVFAETQPPYAVACYSPSPATLALGNQKIDTAIAIWKRCLETGVWPAYPARVMHVEPPAWEETRMWERQYREEEEAA
jgi:hypothetical protein